MTFPGLAIKIYYNININIKKIEGLKVVQLLL